MPDLSDRPGEIQDALIVDVVRELEDHAAGNLVFPPDPRDRPYQSAGAAATSTRTSRRARDARSSSIAPSVTIRPPTIIATRSQTRSTSSS